MRKSIRVAARLFVRAALLGAAAPALGAGGLGGSFVVDDATITPDGHCQLESWIRAIDGGRAEGSSVPACSLGDVEWSTSIDRLAGKGSPTTTYGAGAKWVAGDLDKDGRAWGIAASALRTDGALASEAVYVPMSFQTHASAPRPWIVHLNAGMRRTAGTGWHPIAGIGVETSLDAGWGLLAEFFDAIDAEQTVQIGARWSVTPNTDVDIVAGRTHDAVSERWLTLGLNLAF